MFAVKQNYKPEQKFFALQDGENVAKRQKKVEPMEMYGGWLKASLILAVNVLGIATAVMYS